MRIDPARCLRGFAVAAAILSPFAPASAFSVSGTARAVGPRTVVVHGIHVVLLGIGPLGTEERAQAALQALASAHPLTCDLADKIGHGEFQGSCVDAGGGDVARALVAAGWARADGDRYAAAE